MEIYVRLEEADDIIKSILEYDIGKREYYQCFGGYYNKDKYLKGHCQYNKEFSVCIVCKKMCNYIKKYNLVVEDVCY